MVTKSYQNTCLTHLHLPERRDTFNSFVVHTVFTNSLPIQTTRESVHTLFISPDPDLSVYPSKAGACYDQ